MTKRIAVLTSGGDAPGMNAAIRSVTRCALDLGWEVLGVRNGYEGLIAGEFQQFNARSVSNILKNGQLPRLSIIRLGNDHTAGTRVGYPTPRAMIAENDVATGRVVEAITNSVYWHESAIFILEDDAQNGPDHVDAHRSPAFVISPFTRRGALDSTLYTTSGMLRTMELILGLPPMSQYDAAATPMYNAFQATPVLTPSTLRPARIDIKEMNAANAWGAEASARMYLAEADLAPELELGWAGRGPSLQPPAPGREAAS